jgi:(p)ppGpp synthase/HD superfamily hydrolase
MNILDKAIIFATEKHEGMTRKGTDIPYIITSDPEILAAAALHYMIEDTSTTMAELEAVLVSGLPNLLLRIAKIRCRICRRQKHGN